MNPRKKAKELVDKFYERIDIVGYYQSKQGANICVEEIIHLLDEQEHNYSGKVNNSFGQEYWVNVIQEINRL